MANDPVSSGILGYGIPGYLIPGSDFNLPPASSIQDLELVIYDKIMDAAGRISNAESFTFRENWYAPHTWELKINADKLEAYQLLTEIKTEGHIGFIGDDLAVKVGIIEDIVKPNGILGDQWSITVRGVLAHLEKRKMMAGFKTTTGYDAVSGVKWSTAMRRYVDRNCINALGEGGVADAGRVIPGLTLESEDPLTNGDAAADCDFPGRAQTLLETEVGFQTSSGLSCDLFWIGMRDAVGTRKKFEFRIIQSRDLSADVELSMDMGNVLSTKFKESTLGYRNCIYVAGTGDAAARTLVKVYDGTEPTGWDRYEDYVDATDCTTTAELTQRGVETLTLKAGTRVLEFEFDTSSVSEKYGIDFRCGDFVTVVDYKYGVSMVDRITSVTTTWTKDGKKISLGMGTAAPDLVKTMLIERKQNPGVRR